MKHTATKIARTILFASLAAILCILSTAIEAAEQRPAWTATAPKLSPQEHVIATTINPDPEVYPTIHCRLHRRDIAFFTVQYPGVPGYRLDGCVYEPSDGFLFVDFESVSLPEDNMMVLRHRLREYPNVLHVTTFLAGPGTVEVVGSLEIDEDYEGESKPLPENLPLPNLCWGLYNSPTFCGGGDTAHAESRENYQDWISRVFIYTDEGRTFLDETERRKTAEVPKDDPRNNPVRPQHYIGVWQDYDEEAPHPNTSPDRYTIPVIGAVSTDGEYLTALACDSTRYVAQAWHTCLHHVAKWTPENVPLLDRDWRMKLYIMENDPDALLQKIKEDFPKAAKLKEMRTSENEPVKKASHEDGKLRMIIESFSHPYWYAEKGNQAAADAFWDKEAWERKIRNNVENNYNAILFSCDPWLVHQWQTWLIPHKEFPEARELDPEEQQKIIDHVNWIFNKSHEYGLKNYLMTMFIVTTPSFARAHGMDEDMPVSETVDWRHNYQHVTPSMTYDKMIHWGVRNELTRKFTESAIAEVLQTYPALDGFRTTMGEALPGKRSSWFQEAVLPGLKRAGREAHFLFNHWMVPLEDAKEDIAGHYENIWTVISHNGEAVSDIKPYPISVRYAENLGLPTIVEIVAHNISVLPWNSPEYAHEILEELRKIDDYSGFCYMVGGSALASPDYDLFGKAIAWYGMNEDVEYSDGPWVDILEERYGDRQAAQHFLNAYKASAYITPAVNQIAWCPHDGRCPNQLILKYWHWTDQDPMFSHYAAPTQGATLLPIRYYTRVVARKGPAFRDNDGSDYKVVTGDGGAVHHGHPGAQELMWGHIDYQVTPEAHMRMIKRYGQECYEEAAKAMKTVKKNKQQAETLYKKMKTYKLLTEYFEKKVLAAISALIYSQNHDPEEKQQAQRLADEALESYKVAANYIWKELDNESGNIKGGWWDEQKDAMGLIELEKKDREQLAELFNWPEAEKDDEDSSGANLGTTLKDE